ncbi:lipid-A-disaccharide synthase [candidate division KSB1 bacterium]|nr:lipid-A-disaccharide synthase [bacterium]NUM63750.1 lipid-A-disaccharide synthase [candidate division KSB1 bacterium]
MPTSPDILIVAGEASGDLHGARLVQALKAAAPTCRIFGIGGDGMAGAGMELLFHIRDMAVVGFSEVIRHLPFLRKVMATLLAEVERRRPAVVILIDYPGFNLRLARRLQRHGCKILYYIAPQVWAWGKNRIPKMAKLVDELAVVFPFEEPLFADAGVRTHFVGHPLLEGLSPRLSRREFFAAHGFVEGKPLLGLLPGSRHHEIMRLLPDMITTAQQLRQRHPGLQIAVGQAPTLPVRLYQEMIPNGEVRLLSDATYELMRDSTACLVCSGTATLETACFGTPLAIVYRVSRLSYAIGKRLVKLPHIGLVNVVANRKIAPEFVQEAFQPQHVAEALSPYLQPTPEREAICQALLQVRERLGTPGASQRTAAIALRLAGVSPATEE